MNQPLKPVDSLAFRHFLRELFEPIPSPELDMNLQRAGVSAEGLRPYRRFLTCLFTLAADTYLGGEGGVAYTSADRQAHFRWCLTQADEHCRDDGYRYLENAELADYLREYLHLELYARPAAPTAAQLNTLLDPATVTARSDVKSLIELFEVFQATPVRGRRLRQPRIHR